MKRVGRVPVIIHVFVCNNSRPPGDLPSCGGNGTALFESLKTWVLENNIGRFVFVTQTQCLGYCHADGATLALYAQGEEPIFLQATRAEDVDALLTAFIVPKLS